MYASGGPVSWSVDPLGTSSVLSFSDDNGNPVSSGTLQPGQPFVLTVSADPARLVAGSGPLEITLLPGSQVIQVQVPGLPLP
jgi:hypothetical protein